MISLDLMKSSEVRIAGDQPNRSEDLDLLLISFRLMSQRSNSSKEILHCNDRNDVLKKFLVLGKWARLV